MALDFRKFVYGIVLKGETSDPADNKEGSLWSNSTSDRFKGFIEGAIRELTTNDQSQTLTNKTIDGDNNTVQDLALTSLKTVLADANKIIQRDASGVVVSGPLVNPSSGDVVTEDATQTLTNKTIDGDDNTIQDLALSSLKTVLADANKLIVRDGSGAVVSSSSLPSDITLDVSDADFSIHNDADPTKIAEFDASAITTGTTRSFQFPDADTTLVGDDATQTLTNKTIDGDTNTVQDLALTSLKTNLTDASKFLVRDASGIVVSNTKAVPGGDVLGSNDSQVVSNKDFQDQTTTFHDNGDSAKKFKFEASSITTGNTRTYTVVDQDTTLVGTDVTQTLSNKTLVDPITDILTTTEQGSSPATPASGFTTIYSKTDGFLYYKNDSGAEVKLQAGSGGINYILNPDAEGGTTGWAAYSDAAGVQPVNGTGGSPVTTITASSSSPLRGLQSFVITKDAANRQGEGVSYDFSIDLADRASIQTVEFDYLPSSGFVSGASSDIRMWIYDVTNASLIAMVPYTIDGGGSVSSHFKAQFQAAANSSSYRLIFHIATTNASAWTFKFDNVQVGPQSNASGDLGDVVATIVDASGTSVTSSFVTVVPTTIERDTHSGWSSGVYTLPASGYYNIDAVLQLNSASYTAGDAVSLAYRINGGSDVGISGTRVQVTATVSILTSGAALFYANAGDTVEIRAASSVTTGVSLYRASINSISGSIELGGSEVVAFRASEVGLSIPNVTETTVNPSTIDFDTHDAFDTGTGEYIAPISGYYRVSSNAYNGGSFTANTGQIEFYIDVNGTKVAYTSNSIGAATADGASISTLLKLVIGDVVRVRIYQANGASRNLNFDIGIERITAPASITANESVNASYSHSAGQSISDNTITIVDFAVEDFDSHDSVTTGGSWKFTAPVSGKYHISGQIAFADNTTGYRQILIYKNNSQIALTEGKQVAATIINSFNISRTINLNVGDFVDIRVQQGSGGSLALAASSIYNWISVDKVGN